MDFVQIYVQKIGIKVIKMNDLLNTICELKIKLEAVGATPKYLYIGTRIFSLLSFDGNNLSMYDGLIVITSPLLPMNEICITENKINP